MSWGTWLDGLNISDYGMPLLKTIPLSGGASHSQYHYSDVLKYANGVEIAIIPTSMSENSLYSYPSVTHSWSSSGGWVYVSASGGGVSVNLHILLR